MFAFLSVFLAVARPCHQQAVCQSAHPSAQMHVVGLFIPFFDASGDISENSGFGGLTLSEHGLNEGGQRPHNPRTSPPPPAKKKKSTLQWSPHGAY